MSERKVLETLYYSPRHGRSFFRVKCSCGETFDFYCWSSVKKCPKCGYLYGHMDQVEAKPETLKEYVSLRMPVKERIPREVTARCSSCGQKIVYQGFGWVHVDKTGHEALLDVESYVKGGM